MFIIHQSNSKRETLLRIMNLGIPSNVDTESSVMLFVGTTLSPTILNLQSFHRVLICDSTTNVSLFSHTSSELDGEGTIQVDAYNLNRVGIFDGKFPFDGVIILQDVLCTKDIIFNVLLISFH